MSILYLVRHGQASLNGDDYDVLSERGAEQSRLLGRFWGERARRFDAVYSGRMKRQRDTVTHLREALVAAGGELPEEQLRDGFDELNATLLFAMATERVIPSCPDFVEQMRSGQLDERGKTARRHMLGIAAKLLERWSGGERFEGMEPFDDFEQRVRAAIHQVMREQRRGKQVLIVSSGGPITAAIRMALGVAATKTSSILFELNNTSVTELRYTEDRLTLTRFNAIGHLPDELHTRV